MKDFTALLQREIKPALGVTEVGAIALAAARAYDAVGGSLLHIQMVMNGGMYKNAFSCAIPGTKRARNKGLFWSSEKILMAQEALGMQLGIL